MNIETTKSKTFFGNHSDYYKFRRSVDPLSRVSSFKTGWIAGKQCLDIGCNTGDLTLAVAYKFQPRTMLGIDKDSNLINEANIKLTTAIKKASTGNPFVPRSVSINTTSNQPLKYPKNVRLSCQDVLMMDDSTKFGFIMCMSVVKWIHLSNGDEGLMTFFRKIRTLLEPGGIFVLEYQPWKSYKNARKTSSHANEMFKTIRIMPETFIDILKDEIGFDVMDKLGSTVEDAKQYDRPMLVLRSTCVVNPSEITTEDTASHNVVEPVKKKKKKRKLEEDLPQLNETNDDERKKKKKKTKKKSKDLSPLE
eukprot:gene1266-2447_t